jgi:hypothetical protein
VPFSIAEKVILVSIFLKVFNINNYLVLGVAAGLCVGFMVLLGHYDLKKGVMAAETSLANAHNPEIKKLVSASARRPARRA